MTDNIHVLARPARMPDQTVAELLAEMIPIHHAAGKDHYVEALSEAIDAVSWRPLREAPRDGTWIFIAVAPAFGQPGFVGFGRWIAAPIVAGLGREKRQLAQAYGGWWSTAFSGKQMKRKVLAWRAAPVFDFSPHEEPDADALVAA